MMNASLRFDRAPRRIYWEVTRACDLACSHCRAEAAPERDPAELDAAARAALEHAANTCPVRLSVLDAIEVPVEFVWPASD